jgi:predicted transcriptional regulator
MVTKLTKAVRFKSLNKIFATLFYIELVVIEGLPLSLNDINMLSLFVKEESKNKVIEMGLELKYANSLQSADNIVSRLVKQGLLIKEKGGIRKISKKLLNIDEVSELSLVQLILHNVETNN